MQDLLRYARVIYDANCVVYYCFVFEERDTGDCPVRVQGPETGRARAITFRLAHAQKKIVTIRKAWDEASRILAAKALDDLIRAGYIQAQLRIDGRVSDALKLRIHKALKTEFAAMSKQEWFELDGTFTPAVERVEALKRQYAEFCLDPNYQKLIPPYKGNPSETDYWLILFSKHATSPLLTNDKEIGNLGLPLKERGFCEMIKPFRGVRI
jgi:hypothetical protein